MSDIDAGGLRSVRATRYVHPLREGGSLPALIEVDGGDLFVAKWRGAGQGATALVAEVIVGVLARALALPVPQLAILALGDELGRTERDPEIAELLRASVGSNFGLGWIAGAIGYDAAARIPVADDLAARIVVFDAYVMNVDRTARNPNLLWAGEQLWLIDHGAALYWHHGWDGALDRPARRFERVKDHVLLPQAGDLAAAGAWLVAAIDDAVLEAAVQAVPAAWLESDDVDARRAAYRAMLRARRDQAGAFLEEAVRARAGV